MTTLSGSLCSASGALSAPRPGMVDMGASSTPIESFLLAEEGFPHSKRSEQLTPDLQLKAPLHHQRPSRDRGAIVPWEVSWALTATTHEKASAQETPDPTFLVQEGTLSLRILQPFFQLMGRGLGPAFQSTAGRSLLVRKTRAPRFRASGNTSIFFLPARVDGHPD